MALALATLQSLDPHVRSYIEELERHQNGADQTDSRWEYKYQKLKIRYDALEERHRLLLHKRFCRSSEQEPAGQQQLFDEAEQTAAYSGGTASTGMQETVTVKEHTRKKSGRKPIDPKHPRIEHRHDIPEEEKRCGCGSNLIQIGEETREVVNVIPEQIWIERHIYPKYACRTCEGSGDEDKPAVRIAPREPDILPRSIATASLIAFILTNKFVDHLPFYRQEKRFERIGIAISRQDMSNWTIKVAQRVQPLIDRFSDLIRGGPFIQSDETPVQVMNEPDRANTSKSYTWVLRGGPPEKPVVLYHYEQTRKADYLREFLQGYTGYVQHDGYKVYRTLEAELSFTSVGCWAHARRKFHEAAKATKAGSAHEAMAHIAKLYAIEQTLRKKLHNGTLIPDDFCRQRREQAEPVLSGFLAWLHKKADEVVPSSLLGTAVRYTLNEWTALVRYLDRVEISPDNNATERAVKTFVIGRKNWMMSGSPGGAAASCAVFSLVETAKQNGLEPFAYLHYVFQQAPHITTNTGWDELLPQNLTAKKLTAALPTPLRHS
jgi:transposase